MHHNADGFLFDTSQLPAQHTVQPEGFEFYELAGDKAAIEQWIGVGAEKLPLRYCEGPPGIKSVAIRTATGTIVLT